MKRFTCCFTGHRKLPANRIQNIKKSLEEELEKLISQGAITFLAGGAIGFDTLASQTILELKQKYPNIRLILILPCKNQSQSWNELDKQAYTYIKEHADGIFYVSDQYFRGCMHLRNRALVDSSDYCVCWLTQGTGGSAYTVDYAKKKGIPVLNLASL